MLCPSPTLNLNDEQNCKNDAFTPCLLLNSYLVSLDSLVHFYLSCFLYSAGSVMYSNTMPFFFFFFWTRTKRILFHIRLKSFYAVKLFCLYHYEIAEQNNRVFSVTVKTCIPPLPPPLESNTKKCLNLPLHLPPLSLCVRYSMASIPSCSSRDFDINIYFHLLWSCTFCSFLALFGTPFWENFFSLYLKATLWDIFTFQLLFSRISLQTQQWMYM